MRVTNKMLINNFKSNLSRNLSNLAKLQEQIATGKEVNKPSDNPTLVIKSLSLNNSLNQNEQYLRNIEESNEWADITETALGSLTDSMQRVRELTIYGANGSLSDTDRQSLKVEVEQIVSGIAQTGNSNYDGRYVFGGMKTTEPPFEIIKDADGNVTDMIFNGDNNRLSREISPNVTMDINVSGDELMNPSNGSDGLGKTLTSILSALENNNTDELSNNLLKDLDKNLDNIIRLRAKMGATANRLESAKNKNELDTLKVTELLSKTEDIDMAEKIMEYKVLESVYDASLNITGKVIQPSLLDFLR